jgi:cytochrome P450
VLEGFDPLSAAFQADPYPALERARREAPVFFYEPLNFWVLSRYDDVAAVIGDFKTFSSRAFGVVPVPEQLADRVPGDFFSKALLASDPPSHTVLRKNAQKALTRGRIAAMEDTIRAIADELIDGFADRGSCDAMTEFCNPLTLRVIVRLVGLPEEDMARFASWSRDVVAVLSPRALRPDGTVDENTPVKPMTEEQRLEHYGRIADARDYFRALIADRREHPADDLVSALVAVKDADGKPALETERIVSHLSEVITAGTVTTANLVGQMLRLFDQHPRQRAQVLEQPALLENAVEEGLRLVGSTLGVFRVTTADVEVRGVEIPAGSLVWACYASTGRDEARFADPDRFDVHRADASDHLEFGSGRHFCMGAPLGRLEARIALETFLTRLPDYRVVPDQEFDYVPSIVTTSLRGLQLEWDRT